MLQFYEKRSWRIIWRSWWFVAFLLFWVVVFAYAVYDRFVMERHMAARRAEVEAELQQLTERRDMMKEKVEYLNSERGIEAEMRRNFDVAQPGEQVVIILEDTDTTTIEPLDTPAAPAASPWYIFWR